MASKKTFLMYKYWIPLMKSLPREKLGDLMYAVACYQDGEAVEIEDSMVGAIFEMFRTKFDSDNEAYKEQCEKNARIARERVVTKRNESSRTSTDMDMDRDKDKESLKRHKTSCSEQSSEPAADCEALILNDGSEWHPTAKQYDEYVRLYPKVDVKRSFADMRAWCLSNPKKRKTKSGITRFVNTWLCKEQDKGPPQVIKKPDKWQYKDQRSYDYDDIEKQLLARSYG